MPRSSVDAYYSPAYEQVKQDVDAIQAGMDTPHPDKGAEYVKPVH